MSQWPIDDIWPTKGEDWMPLEGRYSKVMVHLPPSVRPRDLGTVMGFALGCPREKNTALASDGSWFAYCPAVKRSQYTGVAGEAVRFDFQGVSLPPVDQPVVVWMKSWPPRYQDPSYGPGWLTLSLPCSPLWRAMGQLVAHTFGGVVDLDDSDDSYEDLVVPAVIDGWAPDEGPQWDAWQQTLFDTPRLVPMSEPWDGARQALDHLSERLDRMEFETLHGKHTVFDQCRQMIDTMTKLVRDHEVYSQQRPKDQ